MLAMRVRMARAAGEFTETEEVEIAELEQQRKSHMGEADQVRKRTRAAQVEAEILEQVRDLGACRQTTKKINQERPWPLCFASPAGSDGRVAN